MKSKSFLAAAVLAPCIFWITYFVLSAMYPGYSCFTKAVSELGAVTAAHQWIWNVLGYVLPGLLIAYFAYGIQSEDSNEKRLLLVRVCLMLSGFLMTLSGIFPGDFENKKSLTMLLHTICSFGSYLSFLVGAFVLERQMKKYGNLKWVLVIMKVCVYLTLIFGCWPFVFKEMPALGQRFVFMFFFVWIIVVARTLYVQTRRT